MKLLTNKDIQLDVAVLSLKIKMQEDKYFKIYGVPRGGIPIAYLLSGLLDSIVVDKPEDADIIVDDIIDSGATLERYSKYNKPFYALYENQTEWIIFPWEKSDTETPLDDNFIRIEQYLTGDIEKFEKEKVSVLLKETIKKFNL